MRLGKRMLVLVVMVLMGGLATTLTASSAQRTSLPDSEWINIHEGDRQIDEGEPFYFRAGLGAGGAVNSDEYRAHLFMDGVELVPTFVGCTDLEAHITECDKVFFWDFPQSLEAGVYQFDMKWIAPCEAWIGGEFDGLTIESCLDKKAPMSNLQRQMHLTVGPPPEISAEPVQWTIELDFFDAGVHSIFTIAQFSPVSEGQLDDIYGYMHWPETEVNLCAIQIRDAGPDYVHIGDGYSTGEGCDPPALQDAFDAYGLPEFACVGIVVFGQEVEYCDALEVIESGDDPTLEVVLPDGNLNGDHFPGGTTGFQYLDGSDPNNEANWHDWPDPSNENGTIEMGGVAAGAQAGDWVGIRHTGEGDQAVFQLIQFTFDFWDGDTASGSIDSTIDGDVTVCWWDPNDPENSNACGEQQVSGGSWEVTNLGGDPSYIAYAYYLTEDGHNQVVAPS